MSRYLPLLLLLIAPFAVWAVPVLKPAPKIEDIFGTLAENKGISCKMSRQGELQISVSKEINTIAEAQILARPHSTKRMDGNFELITRMTHTLPKTENLVVADPDIPTVSAGIALYSTEHPDASITFLQQHYKKGNTWETQYYSRIQYNSECFQSVTQSAKKLDQNPVYLKLTRQGNEFTAFFSHDGKKWTPTAVLGKFGFSKSVMIGPAAVQNLSVEYQVMFDEYSLKPLEDVKK